MAVFLCEVSFILLAQILIVRYNMEEKGKRKIYEKRYQCRSYSR